MPNTPDETSPKDMPASVEMLKVYNRGYAAGQADTRKEQAKAEKRNAKALSRALAKRPAGDTNKYVAASLAGELRRAREEGEASGQAKGRAEAEAAAKAEATKAEERHAQERAVAYNRGYNLGRSEGLEEGISKGRPGNTAHDAIQRERAEAYASGRAAGKIEGLEEGRAVAERAATMAAQEHQAALKREAALAYEKGYYAGKGDAEMAAREALAKAEAAAQEKLAEAERALREAKSQLAAATSGRTRKDLTAGAIIAAVAGHYGLQPDDITGTDDYRAATWPRQVAMHLVREHTDLSFIDICQAFKRSRSTAKYHLHKAAEAIKDPEKAWEVEGIRRAILEAFEKGAL